MDREELKPYASMTRSFTRTRLGSLPRKPQEFTPERVAFIREMVNDEMEELGEAETLEDQVDALADAVYYIMDFANAEGVNLDPIMSIVHEANLTKVKGKIAYGKLGKVEKPEDFVDPEELIKQELARQGYDRDSEQGEPL
jgi:predicted HAD superfamily Cof-like phosphohydrolase